LESIVGEGDAALLLELLDNLNEDLDSGTRKVELTPTMVRQDDSYEVLVIRFQGVLPCLHAFKDEWNFDDGKTINLYPRSWRGMVLRLVMLLNHEISAQFKPGSMNP
jgi:hypothetical protein